MSQIKTTIHVTQCLIVCQGVALRVIIKCPILFATSLLIYELIFADIISFIFPTEGCSCSLLLALSASQSYSDLQSRHSGRGEVANLSVERMLQSPAVWGWHIVRLCVHCELSQNYSHYLSQVIFDSCGDNMWSHVTVVRVSTCHSLRVIQRDGELSKCEESFSPSPHLSHL